MTFTTMSEIDYEAEYHKLKLEITKLEAQLRDCKKEDEEPEPEPESTKNVPDFVLLV